MLVLLVLLAVRGMQLGSCQVSCTTPQQQQQQHQQEERNKTHQHQSG
jgi:flagellar hook-length control protein FliK